MRPSGEKFPGWLPLVGRRRVLPLFAITTATSGAVVLILIWTFAAVNFIAGSGFQFSGVWAEALLVACDLPLLLWGRLLLAVTWAYYRRRCNSCAWSGCPPAEHSSQPVAGMGACCDDRAPR